VGLIPGSLNRFQRCRSLLRIAIDYRGAKRDLSHLQSFNLLQSHADALLTRR
jgi:hypothetical protein